MIPLILALEDPSAAATAAAVRYLWQDVDRDGRNDVYVRSPGGEDRLLLHRDGRFEDVTESHGLAGLESTLSVTWTDFEGDGLSDLHVIDALGASRLFHNTGAGFVDVTTTSGVAHEGPALFHEWIDGDGDSLADLHVLTPGEDVLFKNLGSSRFAPIPLPSKAVAGRIAPIVPERFADAPTPAASGEAPAARGRVSRSTTRVAAPSGAGSQEFLGTCGTPDIDDAGAAGCLQASSVPTLGMLYPLSTDLNVDGTGRVGMGTTTPATKLDVDGTIRSRSGGFEFPDGSTQTSAQSLESSFAYGAGNSPGPTLQFLAPPATVTVQDGQKVHVVSNKGFGSRYTAGACCLSLWVGYRLTPGGTIAVLGGGILGNRVNRNSRDVMGVNGVLTGLPAGTYEVGMVGGSSDTHWDFNGAGYTSALVFD